MTLPIPKGLFAILNFFSNLFHVGAKNHSYLNEMQRTPATNYNDLPVYFSSEADTTLGETINSVTIIPS